MEKTIYKRRFESVRSGVRSMSREYFPKPLENKMLKLGSDIEKVFNIRGIDVDISTFYSGYRGIVIDIPDGSCYYVMDMPGSVGLEDHKAGSIYVQFQPNKKTSPKIISDIDFSHKPMSFGDVNLDDKLRNIAYKAILNYFKKVI